MGGIPYIIKLDQGPLEFVVPLFETNPYCWLWMLSIICPHHLLTTIARLQKTLPWTWATWTIVAIHLYHQTAQCDKRIILHVSWNKRFTSAAPVANGQAILGKMQGNHQD